MSYQQNDVTARSWLLRVQVEPWEGQIGSSHGGRSTLYVTPQATLAAALIILLFHQVALNYTLPCATLYVFVAIRLRIFIRFESQLRSGLRDHGLYTCHFYCVGSSEEL